MKKMMMGVVLAAVATGCVSVRQNDGGEECMKQRIVKDAIHEKIAVENKLVEAEDEIQCLFGFICWGSTAKHIADVTPDRPFGMVAKAKNGAYAKACDAAQADQIVGTHYKVTTEDYFVYAKCKAQIKGYPAKITGVEVIEDKDPARACAAKAKGSRLPF